MGQIGHTIHINSKALENPLVYYLDFNGLLEYVESSALYVKNGNLYFVKIPQIYRTYAKLRPYKEASYLVHVVNIQRALALVDLYYNAHHEIALEQAIAVYEELLHFAEEDAAFLRLPHRYYHPSYMLTPGWISGMAQGQFVSLAIRLFIITAEVKFLDDARKALLAMLLPVKKHGCSIMLPQGGVWFEEYAHPKRNSFVLNGNLFSIFALYDCIRSGETELGSIAARELSSALLGLSNMLPRFIKSNFSMYDLKGTVADNTYNDLHVKQLKILFLLSKNPLYDKARLKMEKYEYRDFTLPLWLRLRKMLSLAPKLANLLLYKETQP